ncbi:MAG: hypothetical protein J7M40_20255, partial [Planctomycetes bacterium]|nr:hypothetical protein [Planctomycetota bacterium]
MTPYMRPCLPVLLCALTAIFGCTPKTIDLDSGGASSTRIPSGQDTVKVFFTGNLLGTLQPCGCSAGQLGGLSRRPVILGTVADDRKLVVDTGNLLKGRTPQDVLKLGIIFQALSILKYDVANLNA